MTTEQITLTKKHLAERVGDKHHVGHALAHTLLHEFLDQIAAELVKGNRIEFRDFGVFEPVRRKARTAMNPKTLEKVMVPERTVIKFKPGKLLKPKQLGHDGAPDTAAPSADA